MLYVCQKYSLACSLMFFLHLHFLQVLIKEGFYWILNGLSRRTLEITVVSSCSAGKVMLCNVKPWASPQVCAVVSAPSAALWRFRGHGGSLWSQPAAQTTTWDLFPSWTGGRPGRILILAQCLKLSTPLKAAEPYFPCLP